jgi:hypothetical protein
MKTICELIALIAAVAATVAAFCFFFVLVLWFIGSLAVLMLLAHLCGAPFKVTKNDKVVRVYKWFRRVK